MCDTTLDTTTTASTSDRLFGQVKWFNTKAGYGFITVCNGEHTGKDIFVHYSSILVENSQYKYLVQGEYVEFSLVKSTNDKYEFHAVDVSGINRGSIMCETRKVSSETHVPKHRHPAPADRVRRYNTSTRSGDRPHRRSEEHASGEDGFQRVARVRTIRKRPAPTDNN